MVHVDCITSIGEETMNLSIHRVQEVTMKTKTSEDGTTHWRTFVVRDEDNNEIEITLFSQDKETLSIKV